VDDDIQGVSGGQFKNVRCTLTQQSIFKLAEPVQDAQQWIWERAAIEEHIKKHTSNGAHCINPAQTNRDVHITLAELKCCARRLERAAAKQKRQQLTQPQTQLEEIL